jgi:hypothetical protein
MKYFIFSNVISLHVKLAESNGFDVTDAFIVKNRVSLSFNETVKCVCFMYLIYVTKINAISCALRFQLPYPTMSRSSTKKLPAIFTTN